MPKVSVIVPVFKVEKFIERCARSLFSQTLDDIEYIFVDDVSPDNSIQIIKRVLDEYPERKKQSFFYRMPVNSGQAKVRVFGVAKATGEFIIHCDSDDWVDVSMYEIMYLEAKSSEADVVVCDYIETDGVFFKHQKAFPRWNRPLSNNLRCWNCAGQLWNKLYRSSIYHSDIILPVDNMGEDMAFVYQMAYYCNKIAYIERPFYMFFQNPKSITHSQNCENIYKHFVQTCNNVKVVEKFYDSHICGNEIKRVFRRIKYQEKEKILGIINKANLYYSAWKKTFPEIGLNVIFDREFTFKEKIKFVLVYFRLYP